MKLIDIHTHKFNDNNNVVSLRSVRLGHEQIKDINTEKVRFWLGIHPWDAAGLFEKRNELYNQLKNIKNLAGIGEIGLDSVIKKQEVINQSQNAVNQERVFIEQIEIARERKLPVCLHIVRQHQRAIEIIKRNISSETPVIIHGFTASERYAEMYLEAGCHISYGQRSLSLPGSIDALKIVPSERLFLETDDDNITIEEIYRRCSEVKNIEYAELKNILYNNFINIFGE